MKRPIESDYTSQVAYTRALEAYCEAFAKLAAAKERERIFDMLHEMHAKAKGQHNHYLHAVVTLKQRGEA